ncbi:SLAM family member 9 isoform X1 [Megalobrama amblycephala]|uniref:SLAM family member 9 isoform X1 n=1 Tax=Megalobrama amblycephala TaxID=75352 RepID=UPI002013C94F|nr:SLAM family member 9 isoform X1 [Megalobrama amblycephala]
MSHEPHFDKRYTSSSECGAGLNAQITSVFRDCLELRRPMCFKTIFILYLLVGVFGAETDNTETVSVMVGDSVTLDTDIETIKRNDDILWMFGPDSPDTLIAEIIKWSYMFSVYVNGQVPFKDSLKLDHHTGSLTIKNIRYEHSGVYKLTIINNRKTSHKSFSVKVYAPLPTPIISSVSVQNSTASERSLGPACALMCFVKNVTRATLSLYKGDDLVSSVSGSDLSSDLSLPLDMEYYDENTYSCVVSNPFSNHTTLLNVTELCQPPSDNILLYCLVILVLIPVALTVTIVIFCVSRKHGKAEQKKCPSRHDENGGLMQTVSVDLNLCASNATD